MLDSEALKHYLDVIRGNWSTVRFNKGPESVRGLILGKRWFCCLAHWPDLLVLQGIEGQNFVLGFNFRDSDQFAGF